MGRPHKSFTEVFYGKTLVRCNLPIDVREMKKVFFLQKGWTKDGGKMFMKTHLVLCSFAGIINPCNHIILEWDKDGFDVCLLWYNLPHTITGDINPWREGLIMLNGPCKTSTGRRN